MSPVRRVSGLALACGILSTAAFLAAAQAPQVPAKPAAVAGKWVVTLETEAFTATSTLELKQDGEKLTGTYTSQRYGPSPLTGTIKERALQFSFKMNAEGTEVQMAFSGEVSADGQTIKGKATIAEMGDAVWSAKKNPEK